MKLLFGIFSICSKTFSTGLNLTTLPMGEFVITQKSQRLTHPHDASIEYTGSIDVVFPVLQGIFSDLIGFS